VIAVPAVLGAIPVIHLPAVRGIGRGFEELLGQVDGVGASASPQQKSKPTSTMASLAMPAFLIAWAAPAAGGPHAA
jgi:hypothetical protein